MDQLIVVSHPQPVTVEARIIEHDAVPDGSVGLAYYYDGHVIARGVVTPDALDAIRSILRNPVSLALAATEDESGNIDGRVCLILPFDPTENARDDDEDEDEPDAEPWRASVPAPPSRLGDASFESEGGPESARGEAAWSEGDPGRPHLALLPIGNVIRGAPDRNHPDDVAEDAREMLENLLTGRAQDAVAKAIDDLLDSL